jgi:hypothetical protein
MKKKREDEEMSMPGFAAGFSLYRTSEHYRLGGMLQGAEALVHPAQQPLEFPNPECYFFQPVSAVLFKLI